LRLAKKHKNYALAIIGDLAYETVANKDFHYTCLGGSGYYAAIGASLAQCQDFLLVSSVGEDFDFSLLNLVQEDSRLISVIHEKNTARFFTQYVKESGKRIFHGDFGALESPDYKNSVTSLLDIPLIYLAGGNPERQRSWINELKRYNYSGMIASDTFEQYCRENAKAVKEVFKDSDIVFLNEEEWAILECSSAFAHKVTVLKKGKDGAVLFDSSKHATSVLPQSGIAVEDTNGAGDILAAAFLAKIAKGVPYASALQYAVNLASASVEKKGVNHMIFKK